MISIYRIAKVVCLLLVLAGCKVQLNSGLAEPEANEILARLLANGIVASKHIGEDATYSLMVAEQQFSEAVELLKSYGLPRERYSNMGEIFNSDGLVASPTQERARYSFAKSQELAKSIASMPGVMSVDVHIAGAQADSPFDDPIQPSASVMVKINKDFVNEELIPQIKNLVSFGVQEIEYDQVGVILTVVTPPLAQTAFVNVAGLNVHRDSKTMVQIAISVFVFIIVLIIASSAWLFILVRRRQAELSAK